jgi:hypothetical protein
LANAPPARRVERLPFVDTREGNNAAAFDADSKPAFPHCQSCMISALTLLSTPLSQRAAHRAAFFSLVRPSRNPITEPRLAENLPSQQGTL